MFCNVFYKICYVRTNLQLFTYKRTTFRLQGVVKDVKIQGYKYHERHNCDILFKKLKNAKKNNLILKMAVGRFCLQRIKMKTFPPRSLFLNAGAIFFTICSIIYHITTRREDWIYDLLPATINNKDGKNMFCSYPRVFFFFFFFFFAQHDIYI
jgi:hypothetical protein